MWNALTGGPRMTCPTFGPVKGRHREIDRGIDARSAHVDWAVEDC